MTRILSRLLVRLAIVAASLAWAGFVFTQTIGDPGRGEQIATAVLADDDARAEVVAPITAAVMRTGGVPADQQPLVADQVHRLLLDPTAARSFVDPFAGSWARMLGEDDPRPAEVDVAPLLDQLAGSAAGGAVPQGASAGTLPVPGVPLPRIELDWMSGVRAAVSAAVVPLALAAAALFAVAFLIGDRRRVLRRLGVWAIAAGASWVVLPPLVVWAARRWASGADAVMATGLDAATSGLLPVAIALVVGGAASFAGSFAIVPAGEPARARAIRGQPDREPRRAARTPRPDRTVPAEPVPATQRLPRAAPPITRTMEMPTVDRRDDTPPGHGADAHPGDDGDPLWEYYAGSS